MRYGMVFLLALAPACAAFAQEECGTRITPEEAAFLRPLIDAGMYPPPQVDTGDQVLVVPLTFHVCRRSDGSGGIPEARLDQALLDANEYYAPIDIQFCRVGEIDYIDDNQYNPLTSQANVNALRRINVVPGTINIYFTETSLFCGISAFTFSSVQGIVVANACTGLPTNRSTFPHEIGHYFDLFHTHETSFGAECTNGSNCATAGDLVCDTPADPNVYQQVSPACQWTGSRQGPCVNDPPYAPDVTNLMSYSNKDCRDNFTPQQLARARNTLVILRTELDLTRCGTGGSGDMNCDGFVDNEDIDPFALALVDPAIYAVAWPNCDIMNGDINGDGFMDNEDIDPFVALLVR